MGNFVLVSAIWLVVVAALEALRRSSSPTTPWWMMGPVIAWGALVLLPWMFHLNEPTWVVGTAGSVGLDLPNSLALHLHALMGLGVGTAMSLRLRGDSSGGKPLLRIRITALRMWAGLTALLALYALSHVIAQRPLGAAWRLSGDYIYSDSVDGATRLALLDLMPVVAVGFVLCWSSRRRNVRKRPHVYEIAAVIVTALIAVGTGVRYPAVLLVGGWMLLQFADTWRAPLQSLRTSMSVLVGGAAIVIGLTLAAGLVSSARSGAVVWEGVGSTASRALPGVDILGSTELAVQRGLLSRDLKWQSYLEAPLQLIPARFMGATKPPPIAASRFSGLLDRDAGYSAPLWIESAMNGGLPAILLTMSLYAISLNGLITGEMRRWATLRRAAQSLGPAWFLIHAQLLGRMLVLQAAITVGALIIGAYVADLSMRPVHTRVPALARYSVK